MRIVMSGLAALCCLAGCRSRAPEAVRDAGGAAEAAAAPRVYWTLSFAAFRNDRLDECSDFEIRRMPGDNTQKRDAGFKSKAEADAMAIQLGDSLWKAMEPNRKKLSAATTRLAQPCRQQFADRPPFGTCSMRQLLKDKIPNLVTRTLHYSYEDVYKSDAMMRECLEAGAHWDSLPRTSRAVRETEMDRTGDELQHNVDELRKAGDETNRTINRALRDME